MRVNSLFHDTHEHAHEKMQIMQSRVLQMNKLYHAPITRNDRTF